MHTQKYRYAYSLCHHVPFYFVILYSIAHFMFSLILPLATLSRDILWIYNLLGFLTHSLFLEISSTLSSNTILFFFLIDYWAYYIFSSHLILNVSVPQRCPIHFPFLLFMFPGRFQLFCRPLLSPIYKQSQFSIPSSQICCLFLTFTN